MLKTLKRYQVVFSKYYFPSYKFGYYATNFDQNAL